MTPTITAFAASPDRGRGLARDMRVRWALEEVGQAYEVRLLSFAEMKEAAHLARQYALHRSSLYLYNPERIGPMARAPGDAAVEQ